MTLERDDFSSNRHLALLYCWSMIPRVEPEGMLFRKPASTPDQVRGELFRDHALILARAEETGTLMGETREGPGATSTTMEKTDPSSLLAAAPRVVNIGLELFAVNLASHGTEVVHVQWSPPAGGNAHLASLLDKLRG